MRTRKGQIDPIEKRANKGATFVVPLQPGVVGGRVADTAAEEPVGIGEAADTEGIETVSVEYAAADEIVEVAD